MKKILTQVGTLNSLMMGDYYAAETVDELLKNGDIGIGTYEGLDGEAIILNGVAYDSRADGKTYVMDKNDKLPFATVTKFDNNVTEYKVSFKDIEQLKDELEKKLPSKNFFYMIKLEGLFKVRIRSCYKQSEPYEPLYKVACDQREYDFEEEGYVIGVYCPNYVQGMNLPGWHIHFLSKNLKHGGHILKLAGNNISYKINDIDEWNVILPHTKGFETWDLTEDLKEKTKQVEGSSKK